MNRKNLLITLALFAFTPSAMAADCVAEERNGEITESPTNPDSCYFSGKKHGEWEERDAYNDDTGNYVDGKKHGKWKYRNLLTGAVSTGNYVDNKQHGKWETRFADGTAETGNYVDGKLHGKWETRKADGTVKIENYINGELQETPAENKVNSSATSGYATTLNGGYGACLSEDLFDEFSSAVAKEDKNLLQYLLGNGCIITKPGMQMGVLDTTWLGKAKVRIYVGGDSIVVWTNKENVIKR